MSFLTDKQTLDDLNILGKFKAHSIFSLFNQVQTAGGERLLDHMFRNPLSDAAAINRRTALFCFFQEKKLSFPFPKTLFKTAEDYLSMATGNSRLSTVVTVLRFKIVRTVLHDPRYDQIHNGILAAATMLNMLKGFLEKPAFAAADIPGSFQAVRHTLADQRLKALLHEGGKQLSPLQAGRYHYLLLHVFRKEIEAILETVYLLDVCIAVSAIAEQRNFSYAKALPKEDNVFQAAGVSHPALEKAVANPLHFNSRQNLLFLTGANMAGKSTLMKSFGIAVYMAHIGFPVAAQEMTFSVRDGLYTSINVPDNLNMGYSHFYAEVLRVKQVAEKVSEGNNLVVIFDELFKGTNVKDAYDATLSVTEAFAEYRNCFFIISTHIIEVGEALQQKDQYIHFGYMPTVMAGHTPQYTYQLKEGITNDRQGMMIIENEGILETLGYIAPQPMQGGAV